MEYVGRGIVSAVLGGEVTLATTTLWGNQVLLYLSSQQEVAC